MTVYSIILSDSHRVTVHWLAELTNAAKSPAPSHNAQRRGHQCRKHHVNPQNAITKC